MRRIACLSYIFVCLFPLYAFPQLPLNKNSIQTEIRAAANNHHHFKELFSQTTVNNAFGEENIANLYLDIPTSMLNNLDEHAYEDYVLVLYNSLLEKGYDILNLMVNDGNGNYRNIMEYILASSEPMAMYTKPENDDLAPSVKASNQQRVAMKQAHPNIGQSQPQGALSGKTVWLSPGHGWIYYTSLSNYSTQRGNNNDMVEDFGSVEIINYYLLKYLWNAGANVFLVRERDMNPNEVIVDNDDPMPYYIDSGGWATSSSTGYNDGTYRYIATQSTETATATFTPAIPESGWYWVSTYYREGSNRPIDAKYKIHHAGGITEVHVDQEIHGQTWHYIGQFYFDAGMTGKVEISNMTNDITGQAIIADAIRFGGGMGTEEDCDVSGVGTSGKPRFEEGAQLYAPYMGYPNCNGDVSIRPHYAEWELSKGSSLEQNDLTNNEINAIYLSWHTNAASSSTAKGTSSFIYNPNPGSGTNITSDNVTPSSCNTSDEGNKSSWLRKFVHDEVLGDIQNGWDPTWNDRGEYCANFGELRELSTMPGALFEMGFHTNVGDAEAITTPEFRNLEARAVYQGIVRFFNHFDSGISTTMIPEPPSHLSATNNGSGGISLFWNAPLSDGVGGDPATSYKVYISEHGYGFANGINVSGTSYTFSNLAPETTYYFRVSALNDGGESFPTSTVAARTPAGCDCYDTQDLLQLLGDFGIPETDVIPAWESEYFGTDINSKITNLTKINGVEFANLGDSTLNNYQFRWYVGETLRATVPEPPVKALIGNCDGLAKVRLEIEYIPKGIVFERSYYTNIDYTGMVDCPCIGCPAANTDYFPNVVAFSYLKKGTQFDFNITGMIDNSDLLTFLGSFACQTPCDNSPKVLIVDGFDRLQRSQMVFKNEGSVLGDIYRGFLELMNDYTYMVRHARSFEQCGNFAFDGATNEAVTLGNINLGQYDLVDWFLGEESTSDYTFDPSEQTLVQSYLDSGGSLIVSGAEIGWDVGRASSSNAAVSFYNNYLKSSYAGDDGATYDVVGITGGIYDGIASSFDDGSTIYDVNYPDRMAASGGSDIILSYNGGTGDGAATAYKDPAGFGVVNFGFPLEAVVDYQDRNELVCNAINYLDASIIASREIELGFEISSDGKALLKWQTLREKESSTFEIQKSDGGFVFETIAEIPASEYSNKQMVYNIEDEQAIEGETYYRIIMNYVNGSTSKSNAIQIKQAQQPHIKVDNNNPFQWLQPVGEIEDFKLTLKSADNIWTWTNPNDLNSLKDIIENLDTGAYEYIIYLNEEEYIGKFIR